MCERMVKAFMDVVVLEKLMDGEPMGGYDIITCFNRKFHILLSPGTVYSLLYSMERDGLIKSRRINRRRVYKLTDQGEKTIKAIIGTNEEIHSFMRTIIAVRR